ncbi:L,D-transpeptidase family protein [Actinomarinicola tropica]|uniref:L,D-transpeptidase family protein n=1 Tax=Actinomarinicola tropica TaxID=2789776 RepID=A0A5Q2RIY2_9ACTN|nr:L,D-transpeptidase family protein [Actinomarinicola tropica]QGG96818.1 L,D-transpeptidase family protein [Actinomarinicola tropica]
MSRTRTHLLALLLASVTVVAGACGGPAGSSTAASTSAPTSPDASTTSIAPDATPSAAAVADDGESPASPVVVARTAAAVEVFAAPGDATPVQTLPATTEFGSARALLVESAVDGWLEVLLPTRPNGSTGWIRLDGMDLHTVDHEVVVDLTARTLTVLDAGVVVLETPIAVGSDESPTPTGRFSVVDKLDTGAADGPYGPFAFGLSGHSDVITEFAGGDGQIGIHGTNDPSSIGQAVSHGCVRVPNDVAATLNDLLPLGTPVTIL